MTSASGLRSGALAALMLLSLTTGADAFFQGTERRATATIDGAIHQNGVIDFLYLCAHCRRCVIARVNATPRTSKMYSQIGCPLPTRGARHVAFLCPEFADTHFPSFSKTKCNAFFSRLRQAPVQPPPTVLPGTRANMRRDAYQC